MLGEGGNLLITGTDTVVGWDIVDVPLRRAITR